MSTESAAPVCVLDLVNRDRVPRVGEPVSVGIPLPRGRHRDAARLRLLAPDATVIPCQFTVLARWSDSSIRWLLLDFCATSDGSGSQLTLVAGGLSPSSASSLRVEESNGITIDTGAARFEVGRKFPLDSVTVGGHTVIDSDETGLRIVLENGPAQVRMGRVHVEKRGHVRTTVRIDATAHERGRVALELIGRLHFFAGLPIVKLDLTLRNPRKADHGGGFWELGARSSALLKDVSLRLPLAMADEASLRVSLEHGEPMLEFETPFELHQDSSGGQHWNSRVHLNRLGQVPMQFRGYRVASPGGTVSGLRASPIVSVDTTGSSVTVAPEYFWQNCPKAMTVDEHAITIGLFPAQHGDLHELQGGEQKTHTTWLAFDRDPVTTQPLAWCRAPLVVRSTPAWYAGAEATSYLTPASADPHARYLDLIAEALDGPDSFPLKRERIDEYGWRHFGDLYADHEDAFASGPHPIASHYNNQYDAIAGLTFQFLRSGDHRWADLARELARHVVDIDLYHASDDKSTYSHGLFWHTYHYCDAGLSTHRGYPRAPGVPGGGPSPEHNYSTGLLLSYWLTGEPSFREAVLEMATWVLDMDDGRKSVLRWVDCGPTGWASASGDFYQGPGRGPANSIQTLLNAFTVSGDRRYLAYVEVLVRRCIHPDDDLEARDLLNTEARWFYTVFLQALARFLDCKAELGELDSAYAHAQESLLVYARWMTVHEYPYLKKPEKLQYPTETWAAQDMRKSEIFDLAALHARDDRERLVFREKARYFFNASLDGLSPSPTRTFTRPMVLMLSYGFRRAWFVANPGARAPQVAGTSFQPQVAFEPQRRRVMRRAKRAGVALLAGCGMALVMWALN